MEYYLDSEGQGKRDKGARHLVPPPSRPKTGVEPATARTEVWAPRHVVASAKIVRGGEEGLLFCSRSQLFRQRVRGIHAEFCISVPGCGFCTRFFAPSRRPVRLPSRPSFMNPYSPFDPTTPTLTNEQPIPRSQDRCRNGQCGTGRCGKRAYYSSSLRLLRQYPSCLRGARQRAHGVWPTGQSNSVSDPSLRIGGIEVRATTYSRRLALRLPSPPITLHSRTQRDGLG